MEVDQSESTRLTALPPPSRPTDLIQSALFLPLSEIDILKHRGKKLRTIGQILAFDPPSSLLLLSALHSSTNSNSTSTSHKLNTLLINLSIPLLGSSPSLNDLSQIDTGVFSRTPQIHHQMNVTQTRIEASSKTPIIQDEVASSNFRQRLTLERGDFVIVVGWLEGDGSRFVKRIDPGPTYIPPPGIILEAIHISNTRPPPQNAVYRGSLAS